MTPDTEPARLRAALQQLSEAWDIKCDVPKDGLTCHAWFAVMSGNAHPLVKLHLSWYSPNHVNGKTMKDFTADDFYEAIVMASMWIDQTETDIQKKARESNQLAAVLGLTPEGHFA